MPSFALKSITTRKSCVLGLNLHYTPTLEQNVGGKKNLQ